MVFVRLDFLKDFFRYIYIIYRELRIYAKKTSTKELIASCINQDFMEIEIGVFFLKGYCI